MRGIKEAVLALAVAAVVASCGSTAADATAPSATPSAAPTSDASAPSAAPAAQAVPRFEQASVDCADIPDDALADEGKTLSLDGSADEDSDDYVEGEGLDIDQIVCVLNKLEMPTSVAAKLDRTTSQMGVQEDEWGGIKASWTYHPDNGLDIILEDKSASKPGPTS